ncbi:hypothetical protein KAH55_14990 [bacterium]|nr:hypothetical protein [bacterium]
MTSKQRLLTAWSFQEPDRVPIEIQISPVAYTFPEAARVIDFIENEADNFIGVPGADFDFFGLPAEYHEEVIEDVPDDYRRIRRVYTTPAGEFFAITKHNADELIPEDFRWERRFIDTLEEMERLAEAVRTPPPLRIAEFESAVAELGERGLPLVGLLHPLGRLVRNSNMENVYSWLMNETGIIHKFLENTNAQVVQTVQALAKAGIGPYYTVTAHEMLIPPWLGPDKFDEFVFPYDKAVNDMIHQSGGKLRIHCHGNCMNFLERMSEMGVDAIEPLEPAPFGDVVLAEAKKRVGDRMLLSGNVTSQGFLRMTREDVRQAVKDAIRVGAPGGGFTLRTTGGHAATNSVKTRDQMRKVLDNIEAYIDAGLEFGAYA